MTSEKIANAAVKAANIDFATIVLGTLSPPDSNATTTSFSDVSGGSKTITVPVGVTKIKVSVSVGYFDINATSGQFGAFRVIDEDGALVLQGDLRQVAGYAQVVPATVFGFSSVTAGEQKTYKLQGRIDSGSAPLNRVNIIIEAIG